VGPQQAAAPPAPAAAPELVRPAGLPLAHRVALWAVGVVLTVAFAGHAYWRAAHAATPRDLARVNDLGRWLVMLPRFLHAHADYVDDSFPNPPLVMLLLAPLTAMPPPVAEAVWACAKLALAAACLAAALGLVRASAGAIDPRTVWLIVAAWMWPVIGDVQEGQTNLLMLLPLVASLRIAQRERAGRQAAAGLLLGLAIAIKVTPLAFLPYWVWRRRWTLVIAALGGFVLWLAVLPGLVVGFEQNGRWLRQWTEIMVVPYAVRGEATYSRSQALGSIVTRLLRHVPAIVLSPRGGSQAYYVNLVDLSPALVNGIIRALLVGIAAAGLAWARRPLPSLRTPRYALECGAVAVLMLWASERTWIEHYVTLLPTLCAVAMVASAPDQSVRCRRGAWVALTLAALLLASTSDLARAFGPEGTRWTKSLAVGFWASAGLLAVILSARGHDRRNADSHPDASASRAARTG
jgi:hypothetical protein